MVIFHPPRGLLACLLVLLLAGVSSSRAGAPLDGPVVADVVRVVDGDTLKVSARVWLGQRLETLVRLAGIDAPELHGRCPTERQMALQARAMLKSAAGGSVLLYDIKNGKYAGRVVARVTSPGGRDLASELLAAGLARSYDGGARGSWCDRAP